MGEIADMMLEGILCQQCGVYMEGDNGFPRTCSACRRENKAAERKEQLAPEGRCAKCGKKVRPGGIDQHMAAKHALAGEEET